MEVYFSLGSNLGDRKANILKALSMLDEGLGISYSRISSIDESESWGFDGPAFLDAVVCYDLPDMEDKSKIATNSENGTMIPEKTAVALLDLCKNIERKLGRRESLEFGTDGRRIYHDRIIDIDILFLGTLEINLPQLVIPHKLISKRDFIKKPLREVLSEEIATHFKDLLE